MKNEFTRRNKISLNEVKNFGNVRLTEAQFLRLIDTYGEDLALFAIKLLDEKIKFNKNVSKYKKAVTHYQHFRSDGKLINFALEVMNSSEKYGCILY